jgi:hypothetical protein
MELIISKYPWFKAILQDIQDITLKNLYEFYLTNDNIHIILPIITSNSNISIRVIDWFVTNYAKKNNIIYELEDNNENGILFNVYLQYKCQLKSYKKKIFDPFCRKEKIGFYYDEFKCVITTIGQLNFFKWTIKYDVLKYIKNNLKDITDDMIATNKYFINKYNLNSSNSTDKQLIISDSDKIRKKRHELSLSANKCVNIHNYDIVLSFE